MLGDRLGEQGQGTDRRLQLMADVGDEVGAHGIEAGAVAQVVDHCQRTTADQGQGPENQHTRRWTDELQTALRRSAPGGCAQQGFECLVDQDAGVTGDRRRRVAQHRLALSVGEHHAHRRGGEHGPQAHHFFLGGLTALAFALQRTTQPLGLAAAEHAQVAQPTESGSTDERADFWWSGSQPVTMKRTLSAMFTAWSPMRS